MKWLSYRNRVEGVGERTYTHRQKPWGLKHLQSGSRSTEQHSVPIDIVLVNSAGVQVDSRSSWPWLEAMLSADMDIDIYSFGYPLSGQINSVAKDLIQSLDDKRAVRDDFDSPIVFIARGTGGFIIKQALVLLASHQAKSRTRILLNTQALLFFVVPHRGLPRRRLDMLQKTIIGLVNAMTNQNLEPFPSRKELQQMLEAFAPISSRFQIYSFYPSTATNWVEQIWLSDPMTFIMGLPNEEVLPFSGPLYRKVNHYIPLDDPNYRKILSILENTSTGSGFIATRDWQMAQIFRLDGTESESAKQWFTDIESDVRRVVNSRPITRRSRIAIIDSGIDWKHPAFQESIAGGRMIAKSFVEGLPGDQDSDGHGTHIAHVALKVAPNSKLFIARVIEDGTTRDFEENSAAIVEAIKWAVSQGCDIISMSFGYRMVKSEIKAAIREAFHQGVILVAAASNSGVNPKFPITFPASMRQVICIHSSDGNGNPSPQNPPATPDCHLAILGEGVAAAWPLSLFTERQDNLRVASGTSVATAIAAGLAALIIEYAAQSGPDEEVVAHWMQLRHCDEMRKIFSAMARERSGYRSIAPSSFFDYHGEEMHRRVVNKINDVMDSL